MNALSGDTRDDLTLLHEDAARRQPSANKKQALRKKISAGTLVLGLPVSKTETRICLSPADRGSGYAAHAT